MNLRNRRDFYAGLIFVAFGVFFMAAGRNYPMGSALRMGPGYFPLVLGGLLTLLGFAVSRSREVRWGGRRVTSSFLPPDALAGRAC